MGAEDLLHQLLCIHEERRDEELSCGSPAGPPAVPPLAAIGSPAGRTRFSRWPQAGDRLPTSGSPCAGYQTRQLCAGVMGEPALQENAAAKPGWLTMGPLVRN